MLRVLPSHPAEESLPALPRQRTTAVNSILWKLGTAPKSVSCLLQIMAGQRLNLTKPVLLLKPLGKDINKYAQHIYKNTKNHNPQTTNWNFMWPSGTLRAQACLSLYIHSTSLTHLCKTDSKTAHDDAMMVTMERLKLRLKLLFPSARQLCTRNTACKHFFVKHSIINCFMSKCESVARKSREDNRKNIKWQAVFRLSYPPDQCQGQYCYVWTHDEKLWWFLF